MLAARCWKVKDSTTKRAQCRMLETVAIRVPNLKEDLTEVQ